MLTLLLHSKLSLCLRLVLADRGCAASGGKKLNMSFNLFLSPLEPSCLLSTRTHIHTKERTDLTYGTCIPSSSKGEKKKNTMKKGARAQLPDSAVFFLLVLGNLSSHSNLLPGMGKTCRRQDFFSPLITHLHKHSRARTRAHAQIHTIPFLNSQKSVKVIALPSPYIIICI